MKIIHVNRQMIAKNAKDGGRRPCYIVREKSKARYAREIEILGPSKFVSGNQLTCGARAWLETDSDVNLIDECSYQEALLMD